METKWSHLLRGPVYCDELTGQQFSPEGEDCI